MRIKDIIWAADVAEMKPLSSEDQGLKCLCVIYVFNKYARVKPLKYRRGKTAHDSFIKIVDDSDCRLRNLVVMIVSLHHLTVNSKWWERFFVTANIFSS